MMKTIPLTERKVALVDDKDFHCLNQWPWRALKHANTWYAVRNVSESGKRRLIYMHREILKPPADMETDHKNGNGLDNQRDNLRMATTAQNQHNRRKKRGISRFKGVGWYRITAKWRARIVVNKHEISLGYFFSESEAAKAYDRAAQIYFGEFAHTNFKEYATCQIRQ